MAAKKPLERPQEGRGRVKAEAQGCLVIKLWPTRAGLPDRLVLAPKGRMALVEWKRGKGRVTPIQVHVHGKLAALGFPVTVVRSQQEFQKVVDSLRFKP